MGKGKDEETPAYLKAIHLLQKELRDPSQAKFAELLQFSESTISSWLRGDKRRPPSPKAFVKMTGLAHDVDLAIQFLSLAGIGPELLLAASSRLTEVILQSIGPGSVKNLVVSAQDYGGMFADGEVITVEFSAKDSRELQPFWDAVVLVEFTPSTQDREEPNLQWRAWPQNKFWVGRLITKVVRDSPNVFLGILDTAAPSKVYRIIPEMVTWEVGHSEVCIGSYSLGAFEPGSLEALTFSELKGWRKWARQEMKTFEGSRILGRVLGWRRRLKNDEANVK